MNGNENENGPVSDLIQLVANIVSAYVGHNNVPSGGLSALIHEVYGALSLAPSVASSQEVQEPQKPAVSIRKSVTADYIICLDDGKFFKSLKRHLRTQYGITPDEYREKWGLPPDYPMVAPNYAQARSELARKMGLGQQKRRPAVTFNR